MHDDAAVVELRVERALDRIRQAVHRETVALSIWAWPVPGEPVPVAVARDASYEPFPLGGEWGAPWTTTWFRFGGAIPRPWAGHRVDAVLDLGFAGDQPGFQAEGLVHDPSGQVLKGLAPRHATVPLAPGTPTVDLLVEAVANPRIEPGPGPTPLGRPATAGKAPLYRLGRADLALVDPEVETLAADVDVLAGLMRTLDPGETRRHEILRALEAMADDLDLQDVAGTAATARGRLAEVLSRPAAPSAHRISAVGHAHIDSAWLWPLRETVRKCARTFANVLALMEDDPDLVFACSQAQHYAWMKEHQTALYERIRAQVRAGRWVPVGSMWVEPDGNLPGGEALARQLSCGKRFFLDELGVECEEVWLPDSFGCSAAFPQLARLAGCRFFLTQKLSWNQTNRMPHHTFWWEGIDGTRVFTHFPPVDTYNATLDPAELAHAARSFAEKGRATRSLVPFGYGDGGGGPTREMLERARRLADLEGAPRVTVESPAAFFEAAALEYPDAPVWSGELYLELHRGTYTTQARTKRANRRAEHLLREAELWSAAAAVQAGAPYPYGALDRLWKVVLLHQFHDILPGSSIGWVYDEAEAAYAEAAAELLTIIRRALDALGGGEGGAGVANAGPCGRQEVAILDGDPAADRAVPAGAQHLGDGRIAVWAAAPALGLGPFPGETAPAPVSLAGTILDNGLLRVTLGEDGLVSSVLDLAAGREVLAPGGRGNLLQLHPDHPNAWEAWDLDAFYRRTGSDLAPAGTVRQVATGPLVAAIEVERTFGRSRVVQEVALRAGARQVDLTTSVDWHERERILKLAFPLDVHAGRSSAEIQFGHVHRPTHANTSWDAARFEVAAHRFLHVAEAGYGVALANDATYGHDVTRTTRPGGGTTTTVRASLLRAPRFPDPDADQGHHTFRHALVPGAGIGEAVAAGYALNLPMRVVTGTRVGRPLVAVDHPAIVVEAVKLAEDRSGDVVVRLYECRGGRAQGALRTGFAMGGARVTDLLERPLAPAGISDGAVRLGLRPFEILTLRIAVA